MLVVDKKVVNYKIGDLHRVRLLGKFRLSGGSVLNDMFYDMLNDMFYDTLNDMFYDTFMYKMTAHLDTTLAENICNQ